MQNFGRGIEPPKSFIDAVTSSFQHPKSSHNSVIASHPFNFAIQIFIPQQVNTAQIIDKLELSQDTEKQFYYVCEISAIKMIELCQTTLETGNKRMFMHNICSNSQTSNIFAIYPTDDSTHELVMHLDKDTYERMGLQGSHDTLGMYVVKRKLPMKQDSNDLTRIKWAFERIQTPLRLIIATYDASTGNAINMNNLTNAIKVNNSPLQTRVLEDIRVPLLIDNQEEEYPWNVQEKLVQWLGIAACQEASYLLSSENPGLLEENIISELVDDTTIASDKLTILSTNGFIPPHKIVQILGNLQALAKEVQPWCAITVTGFEDSPVSFKGLSHGYGMSGENDYILVVFPNESYWLLKCFGSQEQRN